MAVKITGEYVGGLAMRMTHTPSGATLVTDPPVDNGGQGRDFSPTDLVATGLGACVMSILALMGQRDQLDLSGMSITVEKHMTLDPPRRIGRLALTLSLPKRLDQSTRAKLERAAHTCPVALSLHPDISLAMDFRYV